MLAFEQDHGVVMNGLENYLDDDEEAEAEQFSDGLDLESNRGSLDETSRFLTTK